MVLGQALSCGMHAECPPPESRERPRPCGVGRPLLDTVIARRVMPDLPTESGVWLFLAGREGKGGVGRGGPFSSRGQREVFTRRSWPGTQPVRKKPQSRGVYAFHFHVVSPSVEVCPAGTTAPSLPQAVFMASLLRIDRNPRQAQY